MTPFLPDESTLAALLTGAGVGGSYFLESRGSVALAAAPSRVEQAGAVSVAPVHLDSMGIDHAAELANEAAMQRGAVDERLSAYLSWLRSNLGASAAFVVDADGLVLANRDTPEDCQLASVVLGNAEHMLRGRGSSTSEGNAMVELNDSQVLQLIRAETRVGRLGVGLMLSGPVDRRKADLVRRMLRKVMEWESPRSSGLQR
jgi:predicted regulator of Ras-like GTPase activity (Roadblock/LC7/MglB family)